uniref:Transmembrane protein n=1 Tax=Ascaris lumbricoides TaxID=6252 RepID=A0A0M3HPU6_ASCLU
MKRKQRGVWSRCAENEGRDVESAQQNEREQKQRRGHSDEQRCMRPRHGCVQSAGDNVSPLHPPATTYHDNSAASHTGRDVRKKASTILSFVACNCMFVLTGQLRTTSIVPHQTDLVSFTLPPSDFPSPVLFRGLLQCS